MHEGHRERVREKYKLYGLDGFADHEVLELLLFYANKRSDTNAAAHRLIDRFGSLSAVLEAPYEELVRQPEIGDVAATLITLIPQLMRRYNQNKAEKTGRLDNSEAALTFFKPKFDGLLNERVALVCIDAHNRICGFSFISNGDVSFAQIDIRQTVQAAMRSNAYSVIIAHNHPGGVAAPSQADIIATQKLHNAFKTIGIKLVDHIILTDDESFAMASHAKFVPLFE